MLGERLESLALDSRGAQGDRQFAVLSAEGKLGSGKNSSRHQRMEGLFDLRASLHEGILQIRFPDGRAMRGSEPGIHAALSAALGQPVTLAREAGESHQDAAPIHLVTTASLAWLKKVLPGAQIDERRFRPNLLIDVPGDTPVEQGWLGKTLSIGDARLRVIRPCGRCVMVTMAQSELPSDPKVLRAIAQQADECFGVYAEVLSPGLIRRGDVVSATC